MTSVAAVGSSPIAARRPGWRLVLLGGAAILAPAVQMVEWLRGRPIEVPVVAAGEALTQDLQGADAVLEGVEKGLGEETRVLRHLMSALRPPVLDNRGFAEALSEHVQRFEQENGIAVDIGLGLDSRLPPELETHPVPDHPGVVDERGQACQGRPRFSDGRRAGRRHRTAAGP